MPAIGELFIAAGERHDLVGTQRDRAAVAHLTCSGLAFGAVRAHQPGAALIEFELDLGNPALYRACAEHQAESLPGQSVLRVSAQQIRLR